MNAEDVARDWEHQDYEREKITAQIGEVLFHEYNIGGYEGTAFTLFRDKAGQLMECNGAHCSCYGLEGQWQPEPTFREALEKRDPRGIDKVALAKVVAELPTSLPRG